MERRSFLARCAGAVAACLGFGAAIRSKRWETVGDARVRPEHLACLRPNKNDDVIMLPEQYKTTDGTFVSRLHVDSTPKGFAVSSCGTYLFIALFDEAGVWRHLDSRTMFDA